MVEKEQNLKEEQALKPKPACENVWVIWSFLPSSPLMADRNMIHFIVTVLESNQDQYIFMMVKTLKGFSFPSLHLKWRGK